MWRSFHSLCVNELPPMWNKFLADTGITDVDDSSLITQHVNLKIFEGMLKRYTRIEQVESEISRILYIMTMSCSDGLQSLQTWMMKTSLRNCCNTMMEYYKQHIENTTKVACGLCK